MLSSLNSAEKEIVRRAIDASVNGPFFPDWEFPTLFGISRAEAAEALARFPNLRAENEIDRLAVYNSIANLLGYPHGLAAELEARGFTEQAIRAASLKLRGDDDVSIQ